MSLREVPSLRIMAFKVVRRTPRRVATVVTTVCSQILSDQWNQYLRPVPELVVAEHLAPPQPSVGGTGEILTFFVSQFPSEAQVVFGSDLV
jgi:hypothetical protein